MEVDRKAEQDRNTHEYDRNSSCSLFSYFFGQLPSLMFVGVIFSVMHKFFGHIHSVMLIRSKDCSSHERKEKSNFVFLEDEIIREISLQGERGLPLAQWSINFKLSCWKNKKKKSNVFKTTNQKAESGSTPSPCVDISLK